MKISYNWLKWYVPELPEFDRLWGYFTYHLCEVESMDPDTQFGSKDVIFDLNILPNRAHDLLGHMGVAREIAGQLGLKYVDPTPMYKIPASLPTNLEIKIETEKCRRYMGRVVRGVKVAPSPEWVVKHLASIGQRSINNIVDATNVVLFNTGQPTHAFGLEKLAGEKIVVTHATEGEQFETVGGEKIVVTLRANDMVISDSTKALAIAIAGVKGGTNSGISDNTTEIVLEVANFDPSTVRKTARRLGILSDAAKRFENDLSPELAPYAMRELSSLILEMCPEATFEDVVDVYPNPLESREIFFSIEDINKMLGSNVSAEDIGAIFERYEYSFVREGNEFRLTVPPLRLDLNGPHDMAEEIGRIMGYDMLVPTIPKIDFTPKASDEYVRMGAAREKLLSLGYSEVMTYAFTKKGAVEVARGAKGKEFLRTNLADGLKASYEMNRLNAPLLGEDEIKIFEIGMVFVSATIQELRVAYVDKKGVVESTLEEFTRDLTLVPGIESKSPHSKKFAPWSQYPFITRDIAVWVPEDITGDALIALCKENATELLVREPRIFDQFTKDGKTSLAVRLVFQSKDKTLTDADVFGIMENIQKAIQNKGWEVR